MNSSPLSIVEIPEALWGLMALLVLIGAIYLVIASGVAICTYIQRLAHRTTTHDTENTTN